MLIILWLHQDISDAIFKLQYLESFSLLLTLQSLSMQASEGTRQNQEDWVQGIPSNLNCRVEEEFQRISRVQKTLKEQYLLLMTQQEQKASFEKKLHNTLFAFYSGSVNIGESAYFAIQQERSKMQKSTEEKIDKGEKGQKFEQERRLFEDEGFGDSYTFVKQVMLTLSKEPRLMMGLLQKYEEAGQVDRLAPIFRSVVGSMYENIVDDDIFRKDLLRIVVFCIRRIVLGKKHYFEIDFQEEGLPNLLLRELVERSQVKAYAKQVVRNTLLQIAKLDHTLDFRQQQLMPEPSMARAREKESTRQIQSPIKVRPHSNKKPTKCQAYSAGLREFDEKLRRGSSVKRKYKNCGSEELLRHLGINQEISFPCFSISGGEEGKVEQEINKQLGAMLSRQESKQEIMFNPDSLLLKNIILVFFNDIFRTLYSMPAIMRIACAILHHYLSQSFSPKNCLYILADFLLNFWLSSALQVDLLVEAAKLSPFLSKNVQEVMLVIRRIVRDNSKDIKEGFVRQFHLLVTNLKVSIANYVHEVINIDLTLIKSLCQSVEQSLNSQNTVPQRTSNSIRSYCVCMSMSEIERLLQLIKGAEKEMSHLNPKIFNRVKRIEMMTEGNNIFGDKKDKITGKLYKASKAYALFTQLELPKNLQTDYSKVYRNAFKESKPKNVLKKVLLSLPEIQSYQPFYTSNTIEDLIYSLEVKQQSDSLHSIDHIALQTKLEYLQILSRGVKMGVLLQQIEEQTAKRFKQFKSIWQVSKECYLKAISSLNFQNMKLTVKQRHIRGQIKRRKLEQFFTKNEIKLCLTSPKTREKQIVLKTTLMKDLSQDYKQKLWLQNQSNCIHTALNLEFIKSLTGQPQKNKTRYECHFSSILKFPDILCSLPEVKQRPNLSEDVLGIKDVFFEFVEFIRNFIRSKESQYFILLENMEWLEENIELKIGKRLYDKLYPKYPLYDDIAMYLRLRTLDWISFEHLNIDPQLRNWKVWEVAAAQLRTIDKLRTAAEKLSCIQQTSRIITNSHKLMSRSEKAVTADDFAPLMILVLIMAAPKRLISSINFIQSFASPSKLLSKEGYCLTQIKGALQFCDTVSSDNLKLFQNEATNYIEFNRLIYEKEIHYGIYFLLGRRKDSSQEEKKKMEYLREYFKKIQVS